MTTMYVALAGVAALGVFNLLLTFALIRRQRQAGHGGHDATHEHPPVAIGSGERIGAFRAELHDGRSVNDTELTAGTVVGFFSPGCPPCADLLPAFVEYVRQLPPGRADTLAVVEDSGVEVERYRTALAAVTRVVVEPSEGPVAAAFRVRGFPAVVVLGDEGVVRSSGTTRAALPVPVGV